MKLLKIIVNPHRDGFGNFSIGYVRQLQNTKWVWNSQGKSSKKQFESQEAAEKAAKRVLGNVRFEEVLQ